MISISKVEKFYTSYLVLKKNAKVFCTCFFTIFCIGILLWKISPTHYFLEIYATQHHFFRLSKEQVEKILSGKTLCQSITACPLQSGDILLRRYVTPKTKDFDTYLHPYFTHSAFYLGEGKIVEAVGTEKRKEDEIIVENINDTDWKDTGMEKFVVVHPLYTGNALLNIKANLTAIANDPEFTFGLPNAGNKKTTCAEMIYRELANNFLVKKTSEGFIISPDYLFEAVTRNSGNFIQNSKV